LEEKTLKTDGDVIPWKGQKIFLFFRVPTSRSFVFEKGLASKQWREDSENWWIWGLYFLAYYAASSHNFLPTFRDNLTVQSSRFMNLYPWILDSWGRDGEVVPKRRQEITTICCVINHIVRGGNLKSQPMNLIRAAGLLFTGWSWYLEK